MNSALFRKTIAIVFLTTALAACHDDDDNPVPLPGDGGGDGGGSGGDGGFGVTEITADNAERVARSILTVLTGQEPVPPYCDIRDCAAEPVAVAVSVPVSVRPAAVTVDEQDCPEGGSSITTTEDSGSDQIDAGDTTTTEYFECGIGGNVIDGTLAIEVTAVSGDFVTLPYSVTNKVTYTEYAITLPELTWMAGAFTQIYNGEIVQTSSSDTANDNRTEAVLNSVFEYGDGRMIQFVDFMSESDSSFDATTLEETFTYNGTVTHSDAGIDGELTVTTPEQLVRRTIDLAAANVGYESGRVRIADAAGHYVDIVLLDLDNLQLEADIDDDAEVDIVQSATWEDFFYGNLRAN